MQEYKCISPSEQSTCPPYHNPKAFLSLHWNPKMLARKDQKEYSISMITEEELNQLQEQIQLLKENNGLLKETVDAQQKILDSREKENSLQSQMIDALQRQITLLEQQILVLQVQLNGDSDDNYLPPAPVRFSRSSKSSRKKSGKKRG